MFYYFVNIEIHIEEWGWNQIEPQVNVMRNTKEHTSKEHVIKKQD